MTKAVRVNVTVDPDQLARVDAFAASRREDRSTAVRQLLDVALRELAIEDALGSYRRGRLTLRELGQALSLDTWAVQDMLASRGVAVAQGAREETGTALEDVVRSAAPARRKGR